MIHEKDWQCYIMSILTSNHLERLNKYTNLYECGFVVVSSVSIDALAEQSIQFLQLVHLIAISLGHYSLHQLLEKEENAKRKRNDTDDNIYS